jgi:hypothetical protein
VFYGDGLSCPPEGYAEHIVELLVLRRPEVAIKSFYPGEENLTLEAALRGAPALIGKAPDFVYLAVGAADLLRGTEPESALENLAALLQVLLLKTQARVVVANVCTAFLPQELRASAVAFNEGLNALCGERVIVADLDLPVTTFLEAHRRGGGEKRALHAQPLRLTSMGRVFLSNTAFTLLDLENLFPV